MNLSPPALLALISELYAKAEQLSQENEALRAALKEARQDPALDGTAPEP